MSICILFWNQWKSSYFQILAKHWWKKGKGGGREEGIFYKFLIFFLKNLQVVFYLVLLYDKMFLTEAN